MENARHCLVAVVARGTKSWPETEERKARRPDTELESSQVCRGATNGAPPDQNSYPVGDTLCNWKPVQRIMDVCCNRSYIGVHPITRHNEGWTIRARGRPTKKELQWSNLLVTKA